MRTYTVYKHTSPSGKVYIGITNQPDINRRWQNGSGYRNQKRFYRAIQKYGWSNMKHEILQNGLSKEEAERMEIALIKQYRANDQQYGYNIENGGNCLGTHSEETRKKIGDSQRGEKNHAWGKPSPRRGTKATPEHIEKNRLSHLGKPGWNKGKKMSEEQKKKLKGLKRSAESCKKISEAKSKAVMCIETKAVFESCKQAAETLGINRGSISNAARGKTKTAGGLRWKYV